MTSVQWSTHTVELRRATVVKRFRPGSGAEHAREWRALTLLARYAPDLAPAPLRSEPDAARPTVVMSRLPGTPLRGAPMTERQTRALARTVTALHAAVPPEVATTLPVRHDHQAGVIARLHAWQAPSGMPGVSRTVADAMRHGLTWLAGSGLENGAQSGVPQNIPVIFGPGDGNLANCLWDGTRVRVVDFEDSGRSDRAFELAEITEHVSSWLDGTLNVPLFLSHVPLTPAETTRLLDCRRLLALVWLFLLARDNREPPRNPPTTPARQAARLLRLLAPGTTPDTH
ncbi:phosphotransferase family protein [Streptomyces sp. NPDC088725]|uniref:phosphotransferase family protein n=1 Tax=Streptomyces sp. NPDC088725 TaxID=3365873 RepID=UPI003807FB40